ATRKYMLGNTYTIVDMDVWGWARLIPNVLGEGAWGQFANLKRLVDEVSARPAAQRAVTLKDRHKFKTEMDDEARAARLPDMTVMDAMTAGAQSPPSWDHAGGGSRPTMRITVFMRP